MLGGGIDQAETALIEWKRRQLLSWRWHWFDAGGDICHSLRLGRDIDQAETEAEAVFVGQGRRYNVENI